MKVLLAAAALLAPLQLSADIRYNQVYRVATHNSYWVNRDNVVDPFASGTQERLLDQLLFEGVRGLEIDVHKDDSKPGVWSVYHTDRPANAFCNPFTECLKQLKQFQYALPRHEVVTVVVELKEIIESNFDGLHTPADFDRLLERELGPALYRPRDFLARCTPGQTLTACAAEKGWPTVEELRGKFLFTVLGNWRWCTIGHGPSGWATYATWKGGAAERSAFPMSSDFVDMSHESCGTEYVAPATRARAYDASIFQQVENVTDAAHLHDVARFIAAGGVVRGHDSWTLAEQRDRVAAGMQLIQTDYPWVSLGNRGLPYPFRPLDPSLLSSPDELAEPGERLAFRRTGKGSGFAFAAKDVRSEFSDWETLPATTRPSPNSALTNARWTRGKACLRAASGNDWIAVCRQTIGGHWYVSKPLGEDIAVTVESSKRGRDGYHATFSDGSTSKGAGDQLRLVVVGDGHGGSCATAYTAAEIAPWGAPAWKALATQCFGSALEWQGPSAQYGDAVFFNTRHDDQPVAGTELDATTSGTGYEFRDESVR